MTVRITTSGVALIQDRGRHSEQFGVPVSGAFDQVRYQLVTDLLDEPNLPVIELLNGTVTIQPEHSVLIAAVGNPAEGTQLVSNTSGHSFGGPVNMAFLLQAGESYTVTSHGAGIVYIAISGLSVGSLLGSASSDTMSGLTPQPLNGSVTLPASHANGNDERIGRFITAIPAQRCRVLRYIPGPHAIEDRLGQWTVKAIARSGIRLDGEQSAKFAGGTGNLPSLPVVPGTIQLPPDGRPIVLGPDSGVTGGYPVVGVLVSADLHKLSLLSVGQEVVFEPITVERAQAEKQALQRAAHQSVIKHLHGA